MSNPSEIKSILDDAVQSFVFSGYQLYAEQGTKKLDLSGGKTSYWPESRAVDSATSFDIGSVTKAVATASLMALAVQAGELVLSDPVGERLIELRHTKLGDIRLEHLLTHSSGLVGWYPVFEHTNKAGLIKWFATNGQRLLETKPGTRAVYSDLGFLLLGECLERLGLALSQAFQARIVRPLGVMQVSFGPMPNPLQVAATEYATARGRLLQGEVFDENTYGLGGICGQAGLFASARGLATICREWMKAVHGHSGWLSRDVALRFTRPAGLVAGSTWGYGWDTRSREGSTAGSIFSLKSFGHLGYPGCSVWLDPEREGIAILLTNRVHPSRLDDRIRLVRPRLHDAIARFWRTP